MDEQAKEERVKSGSSSPKSKSCDVLIVGGGLAGLALALQLGEDDVRVILIDKKILGNDAQNNCNNNNKRGGGEEGGGGVLLTPANVLWARKVGIFKELREAEECEVIRNFEGLSNPTLITNGKVAADSESDYLGAVRHTESSDPSSETGYLARELFTKKNYSEDKCSYLNISQSRIEEAILKKLKEKKSVEILWSQGFQKLEAREEGGGLTGYTYDQNAAETKEATHEISCQFVVGCDGKTSDLRKNYFHRDNIETYEWKEYKGVMLHMMCECQLQWPLPRKSYRLEQKSLNGFGPTIGGGAAEPVPSLDKTLFRLSVNAPFTMWGSNIDCLEAPPLSLLQKQLKPKLPKGSKLLTPSWSKYYRMNHFISSSFSYGGAFLVGEAAHAHPPVGILPMNSVIEDTANLAWKLTLAIKLGVTDPECTLLQSYDSERRPQAEKVQGSIAGYFSDLMQGKLKPIHYAHNDCGLFSTYPESPLLVHPQQEDAYGCKVGEIAPSVDKLLLMNSMTYTSLEDLLVSSNKHKIFCFCSDWPVKLDSPYVESPEINVSADLSGKSFPFKESRDSSSFGKSSGHEQNMLNMMTWEKLQQNIEQRLGPEFASLCQLYILHSTPKIAHVVHVDGLELYTQAVHIVDADCNMSIEYFNKQDSFAGVVIRPDLRVAALGEFPTFLEDIGEYRKLCGRGF